MGESITGWRLLVPFGHNTEETYWKVKPGVQVHKGMIQNKWKIPFYLGWNIKSNLCRKQQQTKAKKQNANCYTSVRNLLYIAVRNLDIYTEYINQRVKLLFVIHQISWSIKTKVLFAVGIRLLVLGLLSYRSQEIFLRWLRESIN